MGTLLGTHDLKRCILTIGGRRITGFGTGDAVAVTFDAQRFTKQEGADGEIGRSKSNSTGGTVTVMVHQTNAEMVDYLDSLGALVAPLDVVPIGFVDLNSGKSFIAAQSWLQKDSDKAWGKEAGDFTYVFDCADITFS